MARSPISVAALVGAGVISPRGPASYSPEAQAFFARTSQQLPDDEKAIYNDLFVGLKTDGILDRLYSLHITGARDDQVMSLNLIGGNYTLTQNGIPFHTLDMYASGYMNGFWDTGFTFAAGDQNDAHIGIYSPFGDIVDPVDFGNDNSILWLRQTGDLCTWRINSATNLQFTLTNAAGHFIASRTSANAMSLYKDGVSISSSTSNPSTAPTATYPFRVGGRNGPSPTFSGRKLSVVHFGKGLTAQQAADLTARLASFFSARAAMLLSRAAAKTARTAALKSYIESFAATPSYLFGGNDYFYSDTTGPDWLNIRGSYQTISGKLPAFMGVEYSGSYAVNRGSNPGLGNAQMRARIKDMYDAGGIVFMHDHPNNPATTTTTMDDNPVQPFTSGGAYADRTGNPIAACLSGGSKRNSFLQYVDRVATTLKRMVGSDGQQIPVVMRWWHECNQNFFWWAPSTDATRAQFVQLQKDFWDRLKANGCNSFLNCWNIGANLSDDVSVTTLNKLYPGDSYVDFVSVDFYGDGNPAASANNAAGAFPNLATVAPTKKLIASEVGYTNETAVKTESELWSKKTGRWLGEDYPQLCAIATWFPPQGPAVGDGNNADFSAMMNSTACVTLDKVVGAYG